MENLNEVTKWATLAAAQFRIFPDHVRLPLEGHGIVYKRANNVDLMLNVITPGPETELRPTVIYIHGGGWVCLTKEDRLFHVLPYLARNMNAVLVEYRIANQSLAPAAVEDCRCALRWVWRHERDYGLSTDKLIVMGSSAGGHLALMTGMLDPTAGFDDACAWSLGQDPVKVAAIVNHCGITDVSDLLVGANSRSWALEWFGSIPGRDDLAKMLSPLNHVRKGVPPVITIHGTNDNEVPYLHAQRLHETLEHAGVPNKLVTVSGGGHGQSQFSSEQNLQAQAAIFQFLEELGVLPATRDRR